MTLIELWAWLDDLSRLAFNGSEPLEDRVFYATWWLELAEALTIEMEPTEDPR